MYREAPGPEAPRMERRDRRNEAHPAAIAPKRTVRRNP